MFGSLTPEYRRVWTTNTTTPPMHLFLPQVSLGILGIASVDTGRIGRPNCFSGESSSHIIPSIVGIIPASRPTRAQRRRRHPIDIGRPRTQTQLEDISLPHPHDPTWPRARWRTSSRDVVKARSVHARHHRSPPYAETPVR